MERGREGREGQVGREGAAGREGLPGETGDSGIPGPQGETGRTGAALPRNVRLAFIALVVVVGALFTAVGCVVTDNRGLAKEGAQAHDALCVIRESLERRNKATEEFLRSNDDEMILGVPRETIVARLKADRQTVRNLDVLKCVPPPSISKQEALIVP